MPLFHTKKQKEKARILKSNCLEALSIDNIWIYTLMKSGTTYSLVFLANYLNNIYGDKSLVNFDRMQSDFFLHSADNQVNKSHIGELINNKNKISDKIPTIVHTHTMIQSSLWAKNISLSRNPLDYIISCYFFHHINRGEHIDHPRIVMGKMLKTFIETYTNQINITKKHPEKSILKSYEELMQSPQEVFTEIIHFLGLEYNEEAVIQSMENASKKNIKKMEETRGESIVVRPGIEFKGSFIRSGKIGEWKEYFNDKDLKKIEAILNNENLSLNHFTLE